MAREFRCRLSFLGGPEQEGTVVLEDQFLKFSSNDGKTVTFLNRSMMRESTMTLKEDSSIEIANILLE